MENKGVIITMRYCPRKPGGALNSASVVDD